MACGLPVVAARSGPTMEQVTDGVDGLLFDSGDEASLDAALTRLAMRRRADASAWPPAPRPRSSPGRRRRTICCATTNWRSRRTRVPGPERGRARGGASCAGPSGADSPQVLERQPSTDTGEITSEK